jgi:hypothetical protein
MTHSAPNPNHKDHVGAKIGMPVDVAIVIEDGDRQVNHMQVSKMDHSSGMVKLTVRQYEILRGEINARYNSR